MSTADHHTARVAALAIVGLALTLMLGAAASTSASATSHPRIAATVVKVTPMK
jgi:hypothetical protein